MLVVIFNSLRRIISPTYEAFRALIAIRRKLPESRHQSRRKAVFNIVDFLNFKCTFLLPPCYFFFIMKPMRCNNRHIHLNLIINLVLYKLYFRRFRHLGPNLFSSYFRDDFTNNAQNTFYSMELKL